MKRFLLQMAGLPGSGKSALSREIGRITGAAVIDKDVIMGAAERFGIEPVQLGGLAYEIGYDLAQSILANGHSVVLDSPANFTRIRERGACIATQTGASYFIIECLVSREMADARIAARTPVHTLHPTKLTGLDLDHQRPGTSALTEERLTIDTSQPFDDCVRRALEYIGR